MELTIPAMPIETLYCSKLTAMTPVSPPSIKTQKPCKLIAYMPCPKQVAMMRQLVPRTPSARRKLKPTYFPSTPFFARVLESTSSQERLKVASRLNVSTTQIYPVVAYSPSSFTSAGKVAIRVAPRTMTNIPIT